MGYLAFSETTGGSNVQLAPQPDVPPPATLPVRRPALSALEWTVVALAEHDRLSSLRAPGRLAIALGTVFGGRPRSAALADPRLEALRRIAVLSWHHGYTVPGHEVRRFLEAGFTTDQYELMVDSVGVARAARVGRKNARAA